MFGEFFGEIVASPIRLAMPVIRDAAELITDLTDVVVEEAEEFVDKIKDSLE